MSYLGLIAGIENVLCSTEHLHRQAWRTVLASIGITCNHIDSLKINMLSSAECLEWLLEGTQIELSFSEREMVLEEQNELYRQLLASLGPESLTPKVKALLDELKSDGMRLGVVSTSKNAVLVLKRLGLGDYFDVVLDGNDLQPDMDSGHIYIKALECMDLPYESGLVWENTTQKYSAAKAVGLDVVSGDCDQVRMKLLTKSIDKTSRMDYDGSIISAM